MNPEISPYTLLGRSPAERSDTVADSVVRGRSVLITGAGGTVGRALCAEILPFEPRRLVLLDHSEANLHRVMRAVSGRARSSDSNTKIVECLASVTDEGCVGKVFSDHRVDTVFHAAAYKHVGLVESNPLSGVRNNVLGTLTVARAALEQGVETLQLISTDKAINPASVMGVTKRVSEIIVQTLAVKLPLRYGSVRFGNVFGSSGSVVEIFAEQIGRGGPVTVTDERAARFFITAGEASHMLLLAMALASDGAVYVLDVGRETRIADLARRMIEANDKRVAETTDDDGIVIEYTGLGPGEKISERLYVDDSVSPTEHPAIFRVLTPDPIPHVLSLVEDLIDAGGDGDLSTVLDLLQRLVPEYTPSDLVLRSSSA